MSNLHWKRPRQLTTSLSNTPKLAQYHSPRADLQKCVGLSRLFGTATFQTTSAPNRASRGMPTLKRGVLNHGTTVCGRTSKRSSADRTVFSWRSADHNTD